MADHVIDASAVVALLKPEPVTDEFAAMFAGNPISAVNYSESADYFARLGLDRDAIHAMLDRLEMRIVPLDEGLALDVAMLRPVDLNSSLGDRCCVALAKRLGIPVLTGDHPMAKIASAAGVTLNLFR
ncbi:PIN domain-containing protein [Sphingomonas sp. SUN039]|uniref:PIN domain-containing protein n=1 Tax=Sphingomonas sp. SUN039 TaxID=2937787 RepID=UPI00216418A2|nr:PIN domain-containing protein [Sphingomonas sp. SUN039]UVO54003.1 PIN domain-containing protein [Sphingomonas sp. SUN039]